MQWIDSGVVLSAKRHGETSVILELMTANHGRHLGLVRGGRSRRYAAVFQPGNTVLATWNSRIEEQLGTYTVEAETLRAARFIDSAAALYGVGYLATLLRLLPERETHHGLSEALTVVLDHLEHPQMAAPLVIRFELAILQALGFGLDLSACAATGLRDDLIYVSPKTGRAVSREAGLPYNNRLLRLPAFLTGTSEGGVPPGAVWDGFRLTEHFLARDVFEPRGLEMPERRAGFVAAVSV
jgi:DNA repair protein RecO (recombination protein O)